MRATRETKRNATATRRIPLTFSLLLLHIPQAVVAKMLNKHFAFASPSIPPPPPISMPVWSLACPTAIRGETSMNIVTFCTPVSVAPPKLWVVSLYCNTMTRNAFLEQKVGVLQLLTPSMQSVVPVLGKRSGYEQGYSKRDECHKLGHTWIHGDKQWLMVDSDIPTQNEVRDELPTMELLPRCAVYVRLKLLSTTEAGDHDVALCQVMGTGMWDETTQTIVSTKMSPAALDPTTTLYTAQLRAEGII